VQAARARRRQSRQPGGDRQGVSLRRIAVSPVVGIATPNPLL
jgi:hypothetical protein